MANQYPEVITKYEVMFALRTGVTVMLQKVQAFDGGDKTPVVFQVSPDNPHDIIIHANNNHVVLKGMKKDHLDAAITRGFIMFYEMKGDDIIRSTLCNYQKG